MRRLATPLLRSLGQQSKYGITQQHRHASLTGAIGRGLRKGQNENMRREKGGRPPTTRTFDNAPENENHRDAKGSRTSYSDRRHDREDGMFRSRSQDTEGDSSPRHSFRSAGRDRGDHRSQPFDRRERPSRSFDPSTRTSRVERQFPRSIEREDTWSREESSDSQKRRLPPRTRSDASTSDRTSVRPSTMQMDEFLTPAPLSMPFTTAGSEFLYGTFAVKAALQAERRQMYKLYIYHGQLREEKPDPEMRRLAAKASVSIVDVGEDWTRLLAKMTDNRPHNGYVLEASALPKIPANVLLPVSKGDAIFNIRLGHQSAETRQVNNVFDMTNGIAKVKTNGGGKRLPFILLLDGIRDPGNLGAIIRSAYFLGADGIIVLEHSTAPLSATTLKASGGAAEMLPIVEIKDETNFIKMSQENGWKFVAAVAPEKNKRGSRFKDQVATALLEHPYVLMLGSEGEGLRPRIEKMADHTVTIAGFNHEHGLVDSLNVSVAAALLSQQFLGGHESDEIPPNQPDKPPSENQIF